MKDADRLLAAFRMVGSRGLTRVDFLAPNVIDNGKPVTNFPGRVYDLRKRGYAIVPNGERRNRCNVYTLVEQFQDVQSASDSPSGSVREPADSSSSDRQVVEGGAATLFDEAVGRVTRSAVLEDA
jgi:hypothetical protein